MKARLFICFVLAVGSFHWGSMAGAQEKPSEDTLSPDERAFCRLGRFKDKAEPDMGFDGRKPASPSLLDHGLWVPRIAFSPLYVVSEFGVRRPIGWAMTEIEKTHFFDLVYDFFTWNEHQAGIVPTFFYDFGLLPSVGFYFFWNDFLVNKNHLRVNAGFWGTGWLNLKIADRLELTDSSETGISLSAARRPDAVFQGVGYSGVQNQRSRYSGDVLEGKWYYRNRFWRRSQFGFSTGVDHHRYGDSSFERLGDSRPLEEAVALGWYDLPVGYLPGYTAFRNRLDLVFDTRSWSGSSSSGLQAKGWTELVHDLEDPDSQWFKYGAQGTAILELWDRRFLELIGYFAFVDPLSDTEPPFTELADFQESSMLMSSYLPGTLRGRSASALSLQYRWPIWVFLEGTLRVGVGNAFDSQLRDFHPKRLRLSFGAGLRSIGDRDNYFVAQMGFGTETFENGADIHYFRFVVGSVTAF